MKRLKYLLWILLLLPLSTFAETNTVLPSRVHTVYVVSKGGISLAEIDELYIASAGRYTLNSTARPLGLLSMFRPGKIHIHSEGTIVAAGLKPLSFSYSQEGNANKDSEAKFLWTTHKLSLSHDQAHTELDLPENTQDRLSAMYQFMFLDMQSATHLAFPMTNGSKLDNYNYVIAAGRTYYSAAGNFETLYLDSQTKAGETRTQVWLAKAKFNLPCKVIITDPEGGKLTQELRKLEIQP